MDSIISFYSRKIPFGGASMSVISGEVSSVLMEFYRGHVIEITIMLQKYQNTNDNYVCIISPHAYDEQ